LFAIDPLKYYEFCFELNGFCEQFCIFSRSFTKLNYLTFLVEISWIRILILCSHGLNNYCNPLSLSLDLSIAEEL